MELIEADYPRSGSFYTETPFKNKFHRFVYGIKQQTGEYVFTDFEHSWEWLMYVVNKVITTTKLPPLEKDGELYSRRLRFDTHRTCVMVQT